MDRPAWSAVADALEALRDICTSRSVDCGKRTAAVRAALARARKALAEIERRGGVRECISRLRGMTQQ